MIYLGIFLLLLNFKPCTTFFKRVFKFFSCLFTNCEVTQGQANSAATGTQVVLYEPIITLNNSLCILNSNTSGDYNCSCISGFVPFENDSGCVDFNECNSSNNVCKWDLNECNSSNNVCKWDHSICNNTEGSYHCLCEHGWINDSISCVDVDECKNNASSLCNWEHGICINTNGSYHCSCPNGWVLYDNNSCVDFNECNSSNGVCVFAHSVCKNTVGSYQCSCENGWVLKNENCVDINECNTSSLCNWDHGICINTNGSFNCLCDKGWRLDNNNSCIDINECNASSLCNWDHGICINTNGSFNCLCEEGWRLGNNNSCIDINECNTSSLCNWDHGICINTNGSFNCLCEEGWRLDNNISCIDINECNASSLCNWDHGICININGSFNCLCEEGWILYENTSCLEEPESSMPLWTMWSECSASCGVGKKTRIGQFEFASSSNMQTAICTRLKCPIDGTWGHWKKSECSNSCGVDRIKTQERSCDKPIRKGRYCFGFSKYNIECDDFEVCPVNGGWSSWSDWSLCSQPCQGGMMSRIRDCSDPSPKYGGQQCIGNQTEFFGCLFYNCKKAAFNFMIHLLDEKYEDSLNQPMALKTKIEQAITDLYINYNISVGFVIDLHSVEDDNVREIR